MKFFTYLQSTEIPCSLIIGSNAKVYKGQFSKRFPGHLGAVQFNLGIVKKHLANDGKNLLGNFRCNSRTSH